ncbi:MAG: GGDEF domain-containing response regulator [Candidatus Acidiferrales bacterium]
MKVLLVDDDPVSRLMLLPLLDKWGCDVQVAQDGASAWAALQAAECPRLVLMDWMMPGLSGLEVCKKVRARHAEPYTYIILLTARTDEQDVIEGLESGADDYLTKPCNPAQLRARIRTGERILQMQADLIQARELVRFKSTHDLLTGAWSRGATLDMLARELNRGKREHHPLGLILIDLDDFKNINDTLGQFTGDEVLRSAALRVLSSVRAYDVVGRFAGDEFLILLPGCDSVATRAKAERIRQVIGGSALETTSRPVTLTASLGVLSAGPGDSPTSESTLRAINIALYRAKEGGRNRVELSSENVSPTLQPFATFSTASEVA